MGVKPFAAGNTLESLRDSDFDSCSAYGEVVDNSIQAEAENIRIVFELTIDLFLNGVSIYFQLIYAKRNVSKRIRLILNGV